MRENALREKRGRIKEKKLQKSIKETERCSCKATPHFGHFKDRNLTKADNSKNCNPTSTQCAADRTNEHTFLRKMLV